MIWMLVVLAANAEADQSVKAKVLEQQAKLIECRNHESNAGTVDISWDIALDGVPSKFTAEPQGAVAACLVSVLKTVRFDARTTPSPRVSMPFRVADPPRVQEELSQADIMEGVLRVRTDLVACGAQQKHRAPQETGKIVLIFSVDPSTGAAKVSNPDAEPALFARCVANAIDSVKFPVHAVKHEPISFPFKY